MKLKKLKPRNSAALPAMMRRAGPMKDKRLKRSKESKHIEIEDQIEYLSDDDIETIEKSLSMIENSLPTMSIDWKLYKKNYDSKSLISVSKQIHSLLFVVEELDQFLINRIK